MGPCRELATSSQKCIKGEGPTEHIAGAIDWACLFMANIDGAVRRGRTGDIHQFGRKWRYGAANRVWCIGAAGNR